MKARDRMTRHVVTVSPTDSIFDAQRLLHQHGFRHLPVVDGSAHLVGIATESDLTSRAIRIALLLCDPTHYLSQLRRTPVETCMSREIHAARPETSIDEIAVLLRQRRVGCVPILEEGRLVGILTETDVFQALVDGLGLKESGPRRVYDVSPGAEMQAIRRIFDEVDAQGQRITSLTSYRASADGEGTRIVVHSTNGARNTSENFPPLAG